MTTIVTQITEHVIEIQSSGATGPQGAQGDPGEGVPTGGTTGQVLKKTSNADYDTEWANETGGGGGGVTDHGALTGLADDDHTQYHNDARGDARYEAKNANIQSHISSTSNPHSVTATQVGLGNVDNTSDANKPVSTATQTALDLKVDENAAITGATKTKITYDSKGLVTSGADATTADIADSLNKRYVTDADLTKLSNTSGTNTGDQDLSGYELLSNKENTTIDSNTTKYPTVNLLNTGLSPKVNRAGDTFTGAVIASVTAPAYSATLTYDASTSNDFRTILTGNVTIAAPTSPINGQKILVVLEQDGTGSRVATWNSVFNFPTAAGTSVLTTTANKVDYFLFRYNSTATKWVCLATIPGADF
jgi:hypothetical protein